jgi:RHS repeat-associated protein
MGCYAAGLHRTYGAHHLHFITCSCHRRLPWLNSARSRDALLRILEQTRRRYRFVVVGYVGWWPTQAWCWLEWGLENYAYTLGAAGNRTGVAESNGRTVSYGYDNDYRLLSETITSDPAGNSGAESYTYDAVGNRLTLSSTIPSLGGGMTYSYDANDRLSTDTYDANGNTTSQASITNLYDFENRMTQHGSILLVYDGDGNRVSETIGGTTTKFLVDSLNPTGLSQVLDEIVSGSVTRTYAHGLQRISENQLVGSTWTPSFYGYDGHGNIRFLTNASGAITDSYDDDAFGMPIKTSGTTANTFRYSGERYDSSIGLYDLRARYYNQATGRFWARDPVDGTKCCGLSWNPYIYTKDNAVNAIDPTGKDSLLEFALVYSFAVQRTFVAAVAIGKTTCTLVRFADLAETEIALAKLAWTGEGETELSWRDVLYQQAEQYCDAYFPE